MPKVEYALFGTGEKSGRLYEYGVKGVDQPLETDWDELIERGNWGCLTQVAEEDCETGK